MHDLRVIGVENDALLASADDGTRYRIQIDDETYSMLRRKAATPLGERRIAPRDIQSHIRAGMSAQDVAEMTGAPLEYVEKFEGPVLAERQFVVTAAMAVPVSTASDTGPLAGANFGAVMEERLEEIGAADIEWASWKDPDTGWIVKLTFSSDEVEHDARWQFDPKKTTLAPLNSEATRLSQQGEVAGTLIPRLRAVPADRSPDTTRFDSGAFTAADLEARDTAPYADAIPFGRGAQTVSPSAINTDEPQGDSGNTADLLEALRRRRGERESSPSIDAEEPRSAHPSTGGIRVIDIPLDDFNDDEERSGSEAPNGAAQPQLFSNSQNDQPRAPSKNEPAQPKSQRRGRVSMPSWDDIVFGAKADDD